MTQKDRRLLELVKNKEYELILAELIVKVINEGYLNLGERKILQHVHNELNPKFEIGGSK